MRTEQRTDTERISYRDLVQRLVVGRRVLPSDVAALRALAAHCQTAKDLFIGKGEVDDEIWLKVAQKLIASLAAGFDPSVPNASGVGK